MRYKTIVTTLACCWVLCGTPREAVAQCLGQDSLNCACEVTRSCSLTICVGGTNYGITIEYCQQLPVAGYIRNPCTRPTCARAADQVSWIKRICVPIALQGIGAELIYNGIIKAVNLCNDSCFGATIPNCSIGSSTPCPGFGVPATSTIAYCHIIAFPRCYRWAIGGCLEVCDDACNKYCFAEWRYCNKNNTCEKCFVQICDGGGFTACVAGCTQVDCDDLNNDGCPP